MCQLPVRRVDLYRLRQLLDEYLCNFIKHFKRFKNSILYLVDREIINVSIYGVCNKKFIGGMTFIDPINVSHLMDIMKKVAETKEQI